MKTLFVDANVFLRFFTEDDGDQHGRAADLLRKAAAGKCGLITGPTVLFEIAWTLRSAYDVPREKVLDVLSRLAVLPGLRMLDADLVEDAIGIARSSGQEYADAYILASMRKSGADAIATFNRKHFERMNAAIKGL
ncbi:MAG: putative PilT protein domain protein [Actinobacteria bacterium]|nr:putative PilT protein domain protein [Actinomycetota bacterium]MBM2827936.1 putative PilT protein domain protein [Actinomycetota bacterium]